MSSIDLRRVRLAVILTFGALAGAAAGGGGYAFLSAVTQRAFPTPDLMQETRFILWSLLGAVGGFAATGELARVRPVRRAIRLVLGAVSGAIAAAAAFTIGYVAVHHPDHGFTLALFPAIADAFWSGTRLQAFFALMGAVIGVMAARYSWKLPGLVAYIGLCAVTGGYVLYAVTVSLPETPASALPFSLTLFIAEASTLTLVVVYAFYALDVFQRQRWERAADHQPFSRFYQPKVAFHVATFNEPPDLLEETLDALTHLDYPADRYEVYVADDSTDPETARAIREMTEARGFTCIQREERKGFKAGALNNALLHTSRDVDVIAVIDADYQVKPEYLKETVGHFIEPNLGFVQTPQDYRNRNETFLTRQYYLADAFFYKAILPSRNEGNAIIFCGTMGLVRRRALEEAGGWGEAFITEDAELSVRIFHEGWDALYVDKTYGLGLIPSTYDAYKKQHTRWAFGCVKILRHYFTRFLFGRMSVRQKADFVLGNLHWFDGVFTFIIGAALALLAYGDALGARPVTHHERDLAFFALIPLFFLVDGILRIHGALRSAMPVGVVDTVRTLGMWMSIKFATSFAAMRSLIGFKMPFTRTPKEVSANLTRWEAMTRAFSLTRMESAMMMFMLAASALAVRTALHHGPEAAGFLGRGFLAMWCFYYALLFACAPIYAYLSYRTFAEEPESAVAATGASA